MNTSRTSATIVGILFVIGTAAGILSVLFTNPILQDTGDLVKVATNQRQLVSGALLVLIMAFALAMIPVVLFPILKTYNEALALGAIVFRGVLESAAYLAIVISWLLLITLSQEYVASRTQDLAYFQTLRALLLGAQDWIAQLLAIVFSLGALIIYYVFYQSKLIPRWLSSWGLIGATLYLAAPLLRLFDVTLEILMLPLAVQEMVLALWLIVKGFNLTDITYGPTNALAAQQVAPTDA